MANSGSFNTSTASGMFLNFAWSLASQSVSGNYSDINFTLTGQGGSAGYYVVSGPFRLNVSGQDFNREERINLYPWTTVISGTKRIYHDNSGNASFGASCVAAIYSYAINVSGSGSWELPSIPRQATMTSATDFNDEQNPSFTFENPANASMTCWLEPKPNGEHLAVRTVSGTSGTFTWDLTEEERNQLRNKCTTSNSCICRIGLYSTIGGTTYASFKDITMKIVNADPIMQVLYPGYHDINPTTKWLTFENVSQQTDAVVKGYSNLEVELLPSEAQKGAEMVKYRVKVGSVQAEIAHSDESMKVELDNVDDSVINLYAIDSRGNSSVYSRAFPRYIAYNNLNEYVHTAELKRDVIQNKNVNLKLNGEFWAKSFSSIRKNTIQSITYKYMKTEGDTWHDGETEITYTMDDGKYNFEGLIKGDLGAEGFSSEYSFLINFTIKDYLSTYELQVILTKATPNIAVHRLGTSFGSPYDTNEGGIVQIKGTNIYKLFNRYETVLYEDTSGTGTTGNVVLNESVANYDYIVIYLRRPTLRDSGWDYDMYTEYVIHDANNKIVPLAVVFADIVGPVLQTACKTIQIEDNYISVLSEKAANTNDSTAGNTNLLYIYKVLGYKKVEE